MKWSKRTDKLRWYRDNSPSVHFCTEGFLIFHQKIQDQNLFFGGRKTMSMDLLVRLPDPEEIKKKYPASEKVKKIKVQRDKEIADVFTGKISSC